MSGVCLIAAGAAFEYSSRLQRCISMSTCESEAIAMAAGVAEVDFYRGFARELGFIIDKPWVIHVDNEGTVADAHNDSGKRTRHINLKFARCREAVAEGSIIARHVPGGNDESSEQVADLFTKSIGAVLWKKFAVVVAGAPIMYSDAVT